MLFVFFFFFNDTATTEIYTLSLHDALPIYLLGIDLGRYRDRITYPVASVSVVKFDVHGPLLMKHGDRSHLPAALDNRSGT